MDRKQLGTIGEDTAAKLLAGQGYRIICRNYRCRYGEIDIIASRGNCLYFVEVKTRRSREYGRPCESVTPVKQDHIRKAAACYLSEIREKGMGIPRLSFQVIEILIDQIEDAF